jgi:hypothetical protein
VSESPSLSPDAAAEESAVTVENVLAIINL